MKKLFFILILLTMLLSSCTNKPINTPNDKIVTPEMVESTDKQEPEMPSNEQSTDEYESFEYKITARDYEAVMYLSQEEKAKEFLSVLALGETDLIRNYFQFDSAEEYTKAKYDFKICKSNIDSKYDCWNVKMTVTESTSEYILDGQYDYTLIMIDDISSQVGYFGPTERVNIFLDANKPNYKTEVTLSKTNLFIENLLKDFNTDLTIKTFKNPYENLNKIYHLMIHDNLSGTLEEYKQYLHDRFGYTDDEILNAFENELVNNNRVQQDENGIFNTNCAHGYSRLIYELTEIKKNNGTYRFTYTFYADSAYIIPSVKKTFVFEGNKHNDIMLLTDIETITLSDLKAIRYMI